MPFCVDPPHSDYMICCDPMYNLDIPDHYTSTATYAATLAHKVHLNMILTFDDEGLWMLFSIHCDLLMMKYISFCCEVNYAYCVLLFQACHSFTPNSSFINLYHPRFVIFFWKIHRSLLRFGKIMSIVALRDLHPGEEILVRVAVFRLLQKELNLSWIFQIQLQMQVCYNYKLDKAPQWYQNNWIQHLM